MTFIDLCLIFFSYPLSITRFPLLDTIHHRIPSEILFKLLDNSNFSSIEKTFSTIFFNFALFFYLFRLFFSKQYEKPIAKTHPRQSSTPQKRTIRDAPPLFP